MSKNEEFYKGTESGPVLAPSHEEEQSDETIEETLADITIQIGKETSAQIEEQDDWNKPQYD